MGSTLVTGGARSGKSSFALKLGEGAAKPFYIATGWAGDAEMQERIKKHKLERGDSWTTIETRTGISEAISEAAEKGADFIIVDCLTLWVSNMIMENRQDDIEEEAAKTATALSGIKTPLVFVTNEVGSGVVPVEKMGRDFRDLAGTANRIIASVADEVYLCVSGIPVKIKPQS